MSEPHKSDPLDDEVELEFDEHDLKDVEISDQTLEAEDKKSIEAKKQAKKTAKKILTPEERAARNKKRILIIAGAAIALLLVLLAVPFTRWPILNTIGFRGDAVITVEDEAKKPVANASVRLTNGTVAASDKFGRAYLKDIPLGKQTAVIQKNGYGDKTTTFTNGFGSTQKTEQLKIIGIKLDVDIKDWLSAEAIEGAEVTFGESNALSDAAGRASLVIPPTDEKLIEIAVKRPGYLTKTIETETNVISREVVLVPAQKNYFVSKRDGKFDIFSSNLDGTDQRKIIEATGKEDESLLQLSIHRNNKQAILVSNRDGKVQNRRLVAGVYAIDLERASLSKIDEGSDIQLFGWSENSIAYSKSAPDLNYDDPSFSRIMGFNSQNNRLSQIAAANYFQSGLVAQNKVFYVPADAYRPIENGVLTSHDLGSGAKRMYLQDRQIHYIAQASYQTLELQDASGAAFELQIASGNVKAIDRRPAGSLVIALSPNGQTAAWSDRRDGQGALLARSVKEGNERVVARVGGLTHPVRFVSDNLVVARIVTS